MSFLKSANKSAAHLTVHVHEKVDQEPFPIARMTIAKLMLACVPDLNKSKVWWLNEVGEFP